MRNRSYGGNGQSGSRKLQQPQQVKKIATGLGWFSIGLGVAELIAPDRVARLVGVKPTSTTRTMLRMAGARELAAGIGILSNEQPTGWVWSRVAGDALDISMIGAAMNKDGTDRSRLNTAAVAVIGVTALDILAGKGLSSQSSQANGSRAGGIHVKRSITIMRPREDVYSFWHDFQNLPQFMKHLESVTSLGDGRTHWKAKAPAGTSVEWDAEVTADQPNELIAWHSLGNSDVNNSGMVRFTQAPGARGTEVHVDLRYNPPGGALGALFAKMFGEEPGGQIADDLRRFKQVMELGEIMKSDASIVEGPHPAQPLSSRELRSAQDMQGGQNIQSMRSGA
ncbi:MAG: SRPBCC family protein [Gemmatimonadota bacterium]